MLYKAIVSFSGKISMTGGQVGEISDESLANDLLNAGYSENTAWSLLYSGGLRIYSTQDSGIQKIMDDVLTNEENYPDNTQWLLSYQLSITLPDGTTQNYSNEMLQKYYKENVDRNFDMLFPSSLNPLTL